MRLGFLVALGAVAAAGCGARISPDLAGDAAVTAQGDASGSPSCAGRTVYLNFEGQALTQGPSDATTNHARWMRITDGLAPRYLTDAADRAATIQSIVDGVRARLAAVTVVTDRPAQGPYVMIVFGGTASMVGSRYGGAVNQLDCGDTVPNDVAWIADSVTPVTQVINTAIGAIGFGLGLTATTDPADCMCGWANQCQPDDTAVCTLGSPIARDPNAQQRCAGETSQDEVAALAAAFCR